MELFRTIKKDAEDGYKVLDKISFTLNDGEPVGAVAVKQEDEGMIFYFADALEQEYPMNRTDINNGGYEFSELRKNLNEEILNRFPSEIREKMIPFENGDFLRLATEREIFGENLWGETEDESVRQWEPMKDRRNRICYHGAKPWTWEWCWLQNKSRYYTGRFCSIAGDGSVDSDDASYVCGVRPAFMI